MQPAWQPRGRTVGRGVYPLLGTLAGRDSLILRVLDATSGANASLSRAMHADQGNPWQL